RRRAPGSPQVVCRTARAGLRVTRGQRHRLLGLLVSAGDVWACVLEINAWRRARQDRPLVSYQELCRELARAGPGTFGDLDTEGARSVLRRYSDAWFATVKRRNEGDRTARFHRPGGSWPARPASTRATATFRRRPISPPDSAAGSRRSFRLALRTAAPGRTFPVSPPRDVTHAAAPITAAPAGPLAGTGPPPPAPPKLARESLATRRGACNSPR